MSAFALGSPYVLFLQVVNILFKLWPLWLTPILLIILWNTWVFYVRGKYVDKEMHKSKLLEIKFPQEVTKSPLAMEVVIQSMYQLAGESTWYKRYVEGGVRPWFSLEMTSIGGAIRFFIWCFEGQKSNIEANLYSQYPGIEINAVEDYSKNISYEKGKTDVWCCEFQLAKPSPYPIKTYVDFGLDKQDLDEEFKVDPITPILEYLGSLRGGEQAWLQIVIKAHKPERTVYIKGKKKKVNWQHEAVEEINKIKDLVKPDVEGGAPGRHTKGETETMYALERSVMKTPFDARIRTIYIAPKESFDVGNSKSVAGLMQSFNTAFFNFFIPVRGLKTFLYPWQETEKAMDREKNNLMIAYRDRSLDFPPYRPGIDKGFVLNTEALATMFHIPGTVAQTPSLLRVASKKSEAPANLPI